MQAPRQPASAPCSGCWLLNFLGPLIQATAAVRPFANCSRPLLGCDRGRRLGGGMLSHILKHDWGTEHDCGLDTARNCAEQKARARDMNVADMSGRWTGKE